MTTFDFHVQQNLQNEATHLSCASMFQTVLQVESIVHHGTQRTERETERVCSLVFLMFTCNSKHLISLIQQIFKQPYRFIPGKFPQKYRALCAADTSLASIITGLHWTQTEPLYSPLYCRRKSSLGKILSCFWKKSLMLIKAAFSSNIVI